MSTGAATATDAVPICLYGYASESALHGVRRGEPRRAWGGTVRAAADAVAPPLRFSAPPTTIDSFLPVESG